MELLNTNKLKYKLLTLDELVINIDRLSRFKLPEESFPRVFYSVLNKCLISPKYSKNDLEQLPAEIISKYVKKIWNESVQRLYPETSNNTEVNNALKLLVKIPFKDIEERTERFLNTNLLISPLLDNINYDEAPLNLKFLININKNFNADCPVTKENIDLFRTKKALKFPIKKLLIVEGITEEILLPVFANKLHHNFEEEGIYILGAGGKSKSPGLYMKLRDRLKIPVFLLFDSDAKEICEVLKKKLLKKDKTIIINKGEFEDILSLNLLKRALNNEYETIMPLVKDDLHIYNKMCENIEYYYRTRNLGEFKKSRLSRIIANNIKYDTDITDEIKEIIETLTKNN